MKSLFIYFALLFYTGALLRPLNGNADMGSIVYRSTMETQGGTISIQVIGAIITLIVASLLFGKVLRLRITRELLLITALMVLALASTLWTALPLLCLRRVLALVGTTLFAIALSVFFTRQQAASLLNRFAVYFIFAILAYTLLLPGYSFTSANSLDLHYVGTLIGPFGHKNALGVNLGLMLAILGSSGRNFMGWRLWFASMAVGSIMLLATDSMGNVSALLVAFVAVYFLGRIAAFKSRIKQLTVSIFVVLFALPLGLFWNDIFQLSLKLMGRDATLSDRTVIWGVVILEGMKNWLLGAGYGVAWDSSAGKAIQGTLYNATFRNAHNGYLEAWLELGAVGLILVVLLLMAISARISANLSSLKTDGYVKMATCVFVFLIVTNLTCAELMNYDGINWVMIVTIGYTMSLSLAAKPVLETERIRSDQNSIMQDRGVQV